MSFNRERPFFRKLKATTKNINEGIKEIKDAMKDPPTENTLAYATCSDLRKKATELKKQGDKILHEIQPKLNLHRNYYYDVEELICEIDAETVAAEEYLEEYGYKPISREYSVIAEPEFESDDSHNISRTPIFTQADEAMYRELQKICLNKPSTSVEVAPQEESLDVTPVFDLDEKKIIFKVPERGTTPLPKSPKAKRVHKYKRLARKLEDDY